MAAVVAGAAAQKKRRRFLVAQIAVPAFVLAWRLIDAPVPFYGWGWEMYT